MAKKKILIIDDDADFAEATKVVLEARGYVVSSAFGAKEGLESVGMVCPDLIIMDVMMEKMSDGFDLSRQLKSDEAYKEIPILMVTAIGEKTGFKFSVGEGDEAWLPVNDYAEKPLEPEELIYRVTKLLSKKR